MQIKPILAALSHHRIAATLITLEIALACTVLCNAMFLVGARLSSMRLDSGVDEHALVLLNLYGCDGCSHADLNGRVLSSLRQLPGVQAAGTINSVPFAPPADNIGVCLDEACKHFGGVPHFYLASPGAIAALGLKPSSGRGFDDSDFQDFEGSVPNSGPVWVSHALAEHLWPGENPLGKQIWAMGTYRVAGVLERLARPDPGRSEDGIMGSEWSVVIPVRENSQSGTYLLSAAPSEIHSIATAAQQAVTRAVPEAVLDQANSLPLNQLRERFFRTDRAMAALLTLVIAAMVLVTALGIVGLASFWVAQRTRQIGIRRALGARRMDILHYFQLENFLLTSGGIVLGMLLAYAANQALMRHFELTRLPLAYLPAGALLLWLVGQLAVLGPALRAAAVPPATASRSA